MSNKAPQTSVELFNQYVAYDGYDWHVCSINQSGILMRRLDNDSYKLVNHEKRAEMTVLAVQTFMEHC